MLISYLDFRNLDSSSDLNKINYVLAQNNRVYFPTKTPTPLITDNSGGLGDLHINVEPFYSITKGGMIIQNDAQFNIDLVDSIRWEIILYAQHMSPTSRIELFAYDSTTPGSYPPGCSDTDYHTLLGVVDLTSGSPHASISTTDIIYNDANHADILDRSQFRGTVLNIAALPLDPNWNRVGDIYLCSNTQQLYYWTSLIWLPIADITLAAQLTTHRANGYTDEKHLTEDWNNGLTTPPFPITNSNFVIERTNCFNSRQTLSNDIIESIETFQLSECFQTAISSNCSTSFYLSPSMISYPKDLFLYLRGSIIDAHFYSAVGRHTHTFNTGNNNADHTHPVITNHQHQLDWRAGSTSQLSGDAPDTTAGLKFIDIKNTVSGVQVSVGTSTDGGTLTTFNNSVSHIHSGTTDQTGNVATSYTSGFTFFDDLQIFFDGTNITSNILTALGWSKLGNGLSTHAIVTTGTGAINLRTILTSLGLWSSGLHKLHYSITTYSGGTLESLLRI